MQVQVVLDLVVHDLVAASGAGGIGIRSSGLPPIGADAKPLGTLHCLCAGIATAKLSG